MKRIKWENVLKLIVFLFCIGLIIYDFYMLTIHSFITGNLLSWSYLGFITFCISFIIAGKIYSDFTRN